MKAPDREGEDPIQGAPSWSDVDLKYGFHQKELRDFLALDPVMPMLELKQIRDLPGPLAPPQMATVQLDAVKSLMSLLKEAGLADGPSRRDPGEARSSNARSKASHTYIGSTGCRTASRYVSAAKVTDTSSEPRRMSLGPSGAAMLQARSQIQQGEKSKPRSKRQPIAPTDPTTPASDTSAVRLETYFQTAMSRLLKAQQALPSPPTPTGIQNPGSQDVEMLSAGSPDPDPHWEYGPDDTSRRRLGPP
ncbi:unnamed protein product [Phytophthora fragariaefolia]|uniref:Unnamed protein product n=1 Tax=Phytophthora fragariaefolia TaxID=1490495 RepID=A0A9W6UCS0_9STRA|nr:unnamed protein product [Phytophthora fragariaefolia]